MWEKHTHTDALAAHNGFLYDTRFLSTNTLPITVYYYYYRKNRLGVSLYFSLQRKKKRSVRDREPRCLLCVCVCSVSYDYEKKRSVHTFLRVSILFFCAHYRSASRASESFDVTYFYIGGTIPAWYFRHSNGTK